MKQTSRICLEPPSFVGAITERWRQSTLVFYTSVGSSNLKSTLEITLIPERLSLFIHQPFMTIVACFSLKQAKPTIELKIWPNASPKSFLERKPKMPFQLTPENAYQTLFPANKNKVRKLLHQTIFFVSLFSSKRLRLKSQAVALKNMCDATNSDPLKFL